MKEMLGGFAFLLLLAAQVFAVAALHRRSDRTGEEGTASGGSGAERAGSDRIAAPYPFDRYVDRCRTERTRYLASLFRSART
jgi:hypothetical protein